MHHESWDGLNAQSVAGRLAYLYGYALRYVYPEHRQYITVREAHCVLSLFDERFSQGEFDTPVRPTSLMMHRLFQEPKFRLRVANFIPQIQFFVVSGRYITSGQNQKMKSKWDPRRTSLLVFSTREFSLNDVSTEQKIIYELFCARSQLLQIANESAMDVLVVDVPVTEFKTVADDEKERERRKIELQTIVAKHPFKESPTSLASSVADKKPAAHFMELWREAEKMGDRTTVHFTAMAGGSPDVEEPLAKKPALAKKSSMENAVDQTTARCVSAVPMTPPASVATPPSKRRSPGLDTLVPAPVPAAVVVPVGIPIKRPLASSSSSTEDNDEEMNDIEMNEEDMRFLDETTDMLLHAARTVKSASLGVVGGFGNRPPLEAGLMGMLPFKVPFLAAVPDELKSNPFVSVMRHPQFGKRFTKAMEKLLLPHAVCLFAGLHFPEQDCSDLGSRIRSTFSPLSLVVPLKRCVRVKFNQDAGMTDHLLKFIAYYVTHNVSSVVAATLRGKSSASRLVTADDEKTLRNTCLELGYENVEQFIRIARTCLLYGSCFLFDITPCPSGMAPNEIREEMEFHRFLHRELGWWVSWDWITTEPQSAFIFSMASSKTLFDLFTAGLDARVKEAVESTSKLVYEWRDAYVAELPTHIGDSGLRIVDLMMDGYPEHLWRIRQPLQSARELDRADSSNPTATLKIDLWPLALSSM
eukprot:ANDGO_02849.mRNA.1 hypothetical protein